MPIDSSLRVSASFPLNKRRLDSYGRLDSREPERMHHPGLSPMRLISYVKNPIGYLQSDGKEYITIDGVGGLKAVSKGRGILYSWVQGVGRQAALNCPVRFAADNSGGIYDRRARQDFTGTRSSTENPLLRPSHVDLRGLYHQPGLQAGTNRRAKHRLVDSCA